MWKKDHGNVDLNRSPDPLLVIDESIGSVHKNRAHAWHDTESSLLDGHRQINESSCVGR